MLSVRRLVSQIPFVMTLVAISIPGTILHFRNSPLPAQTQVVLFQQVFHMSLSKAPTWGAILTRSSLMIFRPPWDKKRGLTVGNLVGVFLTLDYKIMARVGVETTTDRTTLLPTLVWTTASVEVLVTMVIAVARRREMQSTLKREAVPIPAAGSALFMHIPTSMARQTRDPASATIDIMMKIQTRQA